MTESGLHPQPAPYQIAYVTTDIDRAVRVLQDMRGIPLQDLGEMNLPLDDGRRVDIRIAMGFVRDTMFELIEPKGGADEIYAAHLPIHGFGIKFHHLAFKVSSLAHLESEKSRLVAAGYPIALAGGHPEQARFIYADFRDLFGHYVEYLYLSSERELFQNSLPRAE